MVLSLNIWIEMSLTKEKAEHTRNSIVVYNKLLQTRIKLQKPQTCLNKATKTDDLKDVAEDCRHILTKLDVSSAKNSRLDLDAIEKELARDHQALEDQCAPVLTEWYNRVHAVSDSFRGFSRPPAELIAKAMEGEDRLIQRTQINRVADQTKTVTRREEELMDVDGHTERQPGSREKVYHAEVFDDSDYYAQLLADFINTKSVEVVDPLTLGQHWVEIQKLRSSIKKKVDTRATKGRKIRYTVIPKLENFVSQRNYIRRPRHELYTETQREILFTRLFGEDAAT